MHIFLQGPRDIGKSTVISKTLAILEAGAPFILGGFFTWNGGSDDPKIYMRPAQSGRDKERYIVANSTPSGGGFSADERMFDTVGASLIADSEDAGLIIMDELGFLESGASEFIKAVYEAVCGERPILGVLKQQEISWHESIKRNSTVSLYEVNEGNRDRLPQELADLLRAGLTNKIPTI